MAGKKRKRRTNKKLPGVSLEETVARIQRMMAPGSTVSHNEVLIDHLGHTNQCDVVIRGTFAGHPILGIIECKDHSRKKGRPEVRDFASKCNLLGAGLRILVSKKGFTKSALELAKYEHVDCLSLLPIDAQQAGFTIGHWWYGVVSKWARANLEVHFALGEPPLPVFRSEAVLWEGKPVLDWFLRELLVTHGGRTEEGAFQIHVPFKEVRQLTIEGKESPVRALTCHAVRIHKNKRKWVSYTGDAFYDWQTGTLRLPAGAPLVGSAVETDVSLWDDYEGELPDLTTPPTDQPFRVIMKDIQVWDEKEVVDLTRL